MQKLWLGSRSGVLKGEADGLIAREEEDGTKRDLFGAAGSGASPMESHDTRDIMLQVCPTFRVV